MDKAAFEEYLSERYLDEIGARSMRNQVSYRTLQWGLILLSASTPVIIALAQKTESMPWLKTASLITAVLVAILATSLKTFKFEENWLNYRTTCETLKKEIHFYRVGIDEYKNSEDKEALFVKRVEALISRENTLWLTTVKEKQDEKPTRYGKLRKTPNSVLVSMFRWSRMLIHFKRISTFGEGQRRVCRPETEQSQLFSSVDI